MKAKSALWHRRTTDLDTPWGGGEWLVRAGLVAAAVVLAHQFQWEWLRYETSEAILRLSMLLRMRAARITFDIIQVGQAEFRFVVSCTFVDVVAGVMPLLWVRRRPIRGNLSRLVFASTVLFGFNVVRLEIGQWLYAHGWPWVVADEVLGGISYFVVWVAVFQFLTKRTPLPVCAGM